MSREVNPKKGPALRIHGIEGRRAPRQPRRRHRPRTEERNTHGFYGAPRCLRPGRPSSGAAPLRVVGVRGHVPADGGRLYRPPGRGVDVSPPQGSVEPFGQPIGRSCLDRLDHRRARRGSAVAACRPVEPRQERIPDGDGVEPRHDLVRVRGELWPPDGRASDGRRGRGGVRHGWRRVAGNPVSGADAQHRDRCLPCGRNDRIGAGRRARRIHLPALGLAGGIRRGRHSRARPVRRVPAGRARLQDGCVALQPYRGE